MAENAKQAVITVLKLGLALSLLLWLVAKGVLDLDSLKRIWSWELALSSLAIVGCSLMVNNTRWWVLLKARKIDRSWSSVFSLTLVGNFFNFALPGGVGGDVVKGYYLVRDHRDQRLTAAMTILVDRILGFYTVFALALLAFLFSPSSRNEVPEIFHLVALGYAGLTVGALILLYKSEGLLKILSWKPIARYTSGLITVLVSLKEWRAHKASIFCGLGLSLVSQSFQVLVVWLTGLAFGAELSLSVYFFLVPLATVATILPLSPAGVGVGQAAAYYLFKMYEPAYGSVGPLGFTLIHAALLSWGLVGALIYVRKKKTQAIEVMT